MGEFSGDNRLRQTRRQSSSDTTHEEKSVEAGADSPEEMTLIDSLALDDSLEFIDAALDSSSYDDLESANISADNSVDTASPSPSAKNKDELPGADRMRPARRKTAAEQFLQNQETIRATDYGFDDGHELRPHQDADTAQPQAIQNYYERLVLEHILTVEIDRSNQPEYIADVACVALNHLPPRYIRGDVDLGLYMSPKERQEVELKVSRAVKNAIIYVNERLRRNQTLR